MGKNVKKGVKPLELFPVHSKGEFNGVKYDGYKYSVVIDDIVCPMLPGDATTKKLLERYYLEESPEDEE